MSIDLSKLTPLPLFLGHAGSAALILDNEISTDSEGRVASFSNPVEAEWHIVARRVLDIQMRRGWYAYPTLSNHSEWSVAGMDIVDERAFRRLGDHPDPFTAIDEAEKFYVSMGKAE